MRALSALVLLLIGVGGPAAVVAAEADAARALAIYRYRGPGSFPLSEFDGPAADLAGRFEALSPADDGDGWNVVDGRGHLATRYAANDVFIVRAASGLDLEVRWGDVPLAEFLETHLQVTARDDGCYSTLHSALTNADGSPVDLPQAILFCPARSAVAFAAPDGYRIVVTARSGEDLVAQTEIGPSIGDNVRLYVREIYPRSPSSRETGSISGNVRAGIRDAGADMRDAFKHAFLVSRERNVHTGVIVRRDAPLIGAARGLARLATGRPVQGLGNLLDGLETGVQAAADVASAVDNSLLTAALQGTVGLASLPGANTAGDWLGAVMQSAIKNLPFGERSHVLLDWNAALHSNRAFGPPRYTRTLTQMNIDRTMASIDLVSLNAMRIHNRSSSSGGGTAAASSDSGPSIPLGGDASIESPFDFLIPD